MSILLTLIYRYNHSNNISPYIYSPYFPGLPRVLLSPGSPGFPPAALPAFPPVFLPGFFSAAFGRRIFGFSLGLSRCPLVLPLPSGSDFLFLLPAPSLQSGPLIFVPFYYFLFLLLSSPASAGRRERRGKGKRARSGRKKYYEGSKYKGK